MDPNVKDFLLAEFQTAFEHIQKIDDRRLRFVEFLISFNAVLATVVVAILTRSGGKDADDKLAIIETSADKVMVWVAAGIALIATFALMWMVNSEREANLRYRRKVNHIRGIFLHDCADAAVSRYLADHKSLGTPTDRSEQPTGWGKTLKGVMVLSVIMVAAWTIASVVVAFVPTN